MPISKTGFSEMLFGPGATRQAQAFPLAPSQPQGGLFELLGGIFGSPPGATAQQPGAMSKPSFMSRMLDPEVALPMASQLMGQNGNMANIGNAFGAAAPAIAGRNKRNKTVEILQDKDPELAAMVAAGNLEVSDAYKIYLDRRKARAPEYKVVGDRIFNTADQSWITPPGGGGAAETGLNAQIMQGEDGSLIYVQPTKDGRMLKSDVPDGFRPFSPYDKSLQTAAGKNDADIIDRLSGDISTAEQTVQQIDELIGNPDLGIQPNAGLGSILGSMDQYRSGWNLGPAGADALARFQQLEGRAFLQAYGMLKGGGQITEIEGIKAQAAMARMNRAQDEATFTQAMRDFRDAVSEGARKLKAAGANIPNPRAGSTTGPGFGGYGSPEGDTNRTSGGVTWRVK